MGVSGSLAIQYKTNITNTAYILNPDYDPNYVINNIDKDYPLDNPSFNFVFNDNGGYSCAGPSPAEASDLNDICTAMRLFKIVIKDYAYARLGQYNVTSFINDFKTLYEHIQVTLLHLINGETGSDDLDDEYAYYMVMANYLSHIQISFFISNLITYFSNKTYILDPNADPQVVHANISNDLSYLLSFAPVLAPGKISDSHYPLSLSQIAANLYYIFLNLLNLINLYAAGSPYTVSYSNFLKSTVDSFLSTYTSDSNTIYWNYVNQIYNYINKFCPVYCYGFPDSSCGNQPCTNWSIIGTCNPQTGCTTKFCSPQCIQRTGIYQYNPSNFSCQYVPTYYSTKSTVSQDNPNYYLSEQECRGQIPGI